MHPHLFRGTHIYRTVADIAAIDMYPTRQSPPLAIGRRAVSVSHGHSGPIASLRGTSINVMAKRTTQTLGKTPRHVVLWCRDQQHRNSNSGWFRGLGVRASDICGEWLVVCACVASIIITSCVRAFTYVTRIPSLPGDLRTVLGLPQKEVVGFCLVIPVSFFLFIFSS